MYRALVRRTAHGARAASTLRVAAVNFRVSENRGDNLRRAAELIGRAAREGAQFVALPECFTGKYGVAHFKTHAEPVSTEPNAESGSEVLAAAALGYGVTTTGGVVEAVGDTLYNAIPAYGPDGTLIANYRKVHLSRVMGVTSEDDVFAAGEERMVYPAGDHFVVGAACCFDLRFPQWLARYGPRDHPVDVVAAPSAFLDSTGQDHWDLSLRRTALDGQCYVVAPNVAYDEGDDVPLHGRAAVVDPWGNILAQTAPGADDLAVADVTREKIDDVRRRLPLAAWPE
jgi:omega-amidase